MKKIEALSVKQIEKFPDYVKRWTEIGLSTELVDLENAKEAIFQIYDGAGLKRPTQIYVVDSPISAISFIRKLDPSLTPSDIFNSMIYGNQDASWLGFYDYFQNEVGVEGIDKLNGLKKLAEYSGWANVFEDVVVLQHRPEIINFDNEKRLHCENGPAIRFRDGFSIYSWHGTSIPSEWIEKKDTLTAEVALACPNVEQRRCAIEIVGWNNILNSLKCEIIDVDGDPEIGTLIEINNPVIGRERFLRVLCGTRREFALPVPIEMKTALEAQAWTWGLDKQSFVIPEIRT